MSSTSADPMPASSPSPRNIRFQNLDEILVDCQRLAAGPCTTLGNWSLAQIISHLAKGIDCTYDGFDFQVHWVVRTFLGRIALWRVLSKDMPRGVRIPSTAVRLLPGDDADLNAALEHLRTSLDRLKREPPTQLHPVFGRLSHTQVQQLMLRHAELHLGLVHPGPASLAAV